jgi:hypothetical protein
MEDDVKFPSTTVSAQTKKIVLDILDPEHKHKNDLKAMFRRGKIVTADDVTDDHLARAYHIYDEPSEARGAFFFCFAQPFALSLFRSQRPLACIWTFHLSPTGGKAPFEDNGICQIFTSFTLRALAVSVCFATQFFVCSKNHATLLPWSPSRAKFMKLTFYNFASHI